MSLHACIIVFDTNGRAAEFEFPSLWRRSDALGSGNRDRKSPKKSALRRCYRKNISTLWNHWVSKGNCEDMRRGDFVSKICTNSVHNLQTTSVSQHAARINLQIDDKRSNSNDSPRLCAPVFPFLRKMLARNLISFWFFPLIVGMGGIKREASVTHNSLLSSRRQILIPFYVKTHKPIWHSLHLFCLKVIKCVWQCGMN